MSKSKLNTLREQVTKLCGEVDVPEPGEFLASLMAGFDPRKRDSYLHNLVERVVKENDGDRSAPPDDLDWEMIVHEVLDTGKYTVESVSLETSEKAATKLMDFLHAKLKALELSGEVGEAGKIAPLTEDEANMFLDIWEKRF